ncbi:Sin3-associated protein, putative [Cordyceps militaris CM01]|uniref:Sin3-associated protein, putative n=1 Tax=Cordyceps militaris (strain CM01) TaxID=983644 RepID=G3J5Z2_CORMM|nr:Sin3-associated protein, putative [Cordyceps militaris CM01]EGX96944.1 Sin3-associated protein, putative [Cordyceps militaris CM01]
MADVSEPQQEPPFLVRLFYNSGSLIHPDRFTNSASLSSVNIFTWPSCTLQELVYELADARPNPLPAPSIGTRVVFQLVYPDLKSASSVGGRRANFAVKDLGSHIVGAGGPGAEDDEHLDTNSKGRGSTTWTLQDAHFAAGDYISCAILPPLSDGTVAPAYDAIRSQEAPRQAMPDQPSIFGNRRNSHNQNTRPMHESEGPRYPRGSWKGNNGREQPGRARGRGRGRGGW